MDPIGAGVFAAAESHETIRRARGKRTLVISRSPDCAEVATRAFRNASVPNITAVDIKKLEVRAALRH
jgi:hypothetical protein